MARKGFSVTRLSIKIALLFFIPILLMTQISGPAGRPIIDASHLNPVTLAKNLYVSVKKQTIYAYIAIKQLLNREAVTGQERVFVYRWKDKYDNWQFSQQPPVNVVTFERVEVIDNSIRMPKPDDKLSSVLAVQNDKGKKSRSSGTLPLSASPAAVKQLIQDTQNIRQGMIDRQKQLQSL